MFIMDDQILSCSCSEVYEKFGVDLEVELLTRRHWLDAYENSDASILQRDLKLGAQWHR